MVPEAAHPYSKNEQSLMAPQPRAKLVTETERRVLVRQPEEKGVDTCLPA
jgi:hypothetical protein